MKKVLLFTMLAVALVLGACSKKEEASPTKEPAKEVVAKENSNELTFEVNGQKKTVPAQVQSLSKLGKEIKVPENFKVNEDPDGTLGIIGEGEFEGINLNIQPVDELWSPALYKSAVKGLSGSAGPYTKFEHPLLKEDYKVNMMGESNERIGIFLGKDGNKPYEVGIWYTKKDSVNKDEILAELVSILNTYKQ